MATTLYRVINRLWPSGLPPRLGVAVSGGSDSMALCWLMSDFCEKQRRAGLRVPDVYGLSVDHGLRPESATETALVKSQITALGLYHDTRTIDWSLLGGIPCLGLEEAARALRYRALVSMMMDHGLSIILMAHHADDVAEQVLMRLSKQGRGVALARTPTVSPMPEVNDVREARRFRVVRPLLDMRKHELQRVCRENGVCWSEDASNHDATYGARNAARALLSIPEQLPIALRPAALVAVAKRVQEARQARIARLQSFIDAYRVSVTLNVSDGHVVLSVADKETRAELASDTGLASEMLMHLILLVTPAARVKMRSVAVKARLERTGPVFTVGRCLVVWGDQVTVYREPYLRDEKVDARVSLGPGENTCLFWDRRWWIRVENRSTSSFEGAIEPLGRLSRQLRRAIRVPTGLDVHGQYSMPVLVERGCRVVSLPTIGLCMEPERVVALAEFKTTQEDAGVIRFRERLTEDTHVVECDEGKV